MEINLKFVKQKVKSSYDIQTLKRLHLFILSNMFLIFYDTNKFAPVTLTNIDLESDSFIDTLYYFLSTSCCLIFITGSHFFIRFHSPAVMTSLKSRLSFLARRWYFISHSASSHGYPFFFFEILVFLTKNRKLLLLF